MTKTSEQNNSTLTQLKNSFIDISKVFGAISVISAVAGIVLAYLQVIQLASGRLPFAHFLINEMGATYFWSGALLYITKYILFIGSFWSIVLLASAKESSSDNQLAGFLKIAAMGFIIIVLTSTSNLLECLIILTFFLIFFIRKHLRSTKNNQAYSFKTIQILR